MTFPRSPRTLRGGIVLLDPASGGIRRVIALQYNPDSVSRTLQVQGAGQEAGDRRETLRLKGPPIETIRLEIELDATDQLEFPDQSSVAVEHGLLPQLAALETIVYPSVGQLQESEALANDGKFEIVPAEGPLTLFVWSRHRVAPVRFTELTIVEEAFDPRLAPIRARVNLTMRVLSVNDLASGHQGTGIYLAYQRQKERQAGLSPQAMLDVLGLESIP
jgi:hypothetical protein